MLPPTQMEQIRAFAEEVAKREGCVLYDLEFNSGSGRTLRVYIDKEPGGVSLDDCVNVSRGLNLRLDVEDVIPGGRYELEVSSPGLERKLTQAWHYAGVVGQTVQLKYKDAVKGVQSYEGKLVKVNEAQLEFENSKGPFALQFEQIEKARVVLEDAFGKKPAPGKNKKR